MIRSVAAIALFSAPVWFVGCGDDEPSALSLLGNGCLLNTDCMNGLVCVFERCHIECNASGDCPLGDGGERLRCVVGDKPEHVCQLQDESSCSYHSECPGLQICGPDGTCRDQCQSDRDCIDTQKCVAEGVCADVEEIDDNGELSGEFPPPEQGTGFPCAYDSQCLGLSEVEGLELVCRQGGCNFACYDDVDCDSGYGCTPRDNDVSTPGNCELLAQDPPCVPGAQVPCTCAITEAAGFQICAPDGQSFGPCNDLLTNEDCSASGG